jgi:hypothetical protein
MGTRSSIARLTAEPIAPEEESIRSNAGDSLSSSVTAPSPPRIESVRATFRISDTASFIRVIAGWDLHPKALRRNLATKAHL